MEVKFDLINVPIFLYEVCVYIIWLDKFFVTFVVLHPLRDAVLQFHEADKCVLSVSVLVSKYMKKSGFCMGDTIYRIFLSYMNLCKKPSLSLAWFLTSGILRKTLRRVSFIVLTHQKAWVCLKFKDFSGLLRTIFVLKLMKNILVFEVGLLLDQGTFCRVIL